MAEVKYKFPKTLGGCADLLYQLRERRLEEQKKVDAIEAEEKALKELIINTLPKSEADGVSGKVAKVRIIRKEVPQIKDYDAFYAYVKKNNAFDLLQRRLNEGAVRERWELGKQVAGVETFHTVTLSVTKA